MLDIKKILAENLTTLLATRSDISRLELSRQMKVGDGTLGSIKYGKGNPTVEVLDQIASFFKLEAWQLLAPNLGESERKAADVTVAMQKRAQNEGMIATLLEMQKKISFTLRSLGAYNEEDDHKEQIRGKLESQLRIIEGQKEKLAEQIRQLSEQIHRQV
jgi:transcriptional regulator with XRE-family HTH domain